MADVDFAQAPRGLADTLAAPIKRKAYQPLLCRAFFRRTGLHFVGMPSGTRARPMRESEGVRAHVRPVVEVSTTSRGALIADLVARLAAVTVDRRPKRARSRMPLETSAKKAFPSQRREPSGRRSAPRSYPSLWAEAKILHAPKARAGGGARSGRRFTRSPRSRTGWNSTRWACRVRESVRAR